MAEHRCDSTDACCAPPPVKFPRRDAAHAPPAVGRPAVEDSCVDSCCSGKVPVFDGLNPRYMRGLWTVIAVNGAMFLTEVVAGQVAGSQALKADALDFLADTVTYGLSLAVI